MSVEDRIIQKHLGQLLFGSKLLLVNGKIFPAV